MKNCYLLLFVFFAFAKAMTAQVTIDPQMDYYLPSDVTYNPDIPTPEEIIGYVPGKWHVTHDKLAQYMMALAGASDRITIENRGKTYEDRPLLLLTITSSSNQNNLESIRKAHQDRIDGIGSSADAPIVIYQGFSIHGNEPSGSNAALLYAYYLAAAQGPQVEEQLKNTVILLDPSFNPDGLQRFAGWVNQHKSENVTIDGNDREYDEVWPGGRTNHYWFDMNRDWLPVQLPESRARIASFNKWMPNILTDHHEMGTNSSFFFQPGIPSRTNPLTPQMNQDLTKEIGKYHAAAFDKIGSFYYTEESFDDFYYGKGSTFPDVNGGIGILFEQASSRGHAQESVNGVLTFPFTIRNQFTAALSTLAAANGMRETILDYQTKFYANAAKEAKNATIIFGDSKDAGKTDAFAEVLLRHEIELKELNKDVKVDGKEYKKGNAYLIPTAQKKSRLINALFQKTTTFTDSLFYDISAWTFPLAFDLDYSMNAGSSVSGTPVTYTMDGEQLKIQKSGTDTRNLAQSDYAYLMEWNEYMSPKVLNDLLKDDIIAKVAMQPFELNGKSYDYGTIMIPVSRQPISSTALRDRLNQHLQETNVVIDPVDTGSTVGIDLGSNSFVPLDNPKIALVIGDGIDPYDAGEIWHLMDQRYDITITKIELDRMARADLSNYNTIIVPSTYGSPDKNVVESLKTWTRAGGTLIGYGNALRWMSSEKLLPMTFKSTKNPATNVTFEQRGDFNGAQVIGGSIFETKLDRSHPIAFGYKDDQLAMFRNSTLFIEADSTSYKNPIRYTDEPLMAGYSSKINLEAIKNTVPFQHNSYGRGEVIGFTDNTNFRAFWYGTNKLLMNAIFFGKAM
ncbi:M14 family metallopeptidase [Nonlabens marinus]|uniref:Secreted protein containing N-terminal Zinc-dependent carboxypeptidase related domain n=1 Tax=Nonlabens marinus S1-08 TaxID=1454201 RepID=W8W020_9FLAO|nr:M14 family metallopeptidase [Nonlabens marinus]BAO55561.1 secreted protein containing N-terminal Zinc-dependent carboxypeptidase related domain [Nonlabens marinus S1-08]